MQAVYPVLPEIALLVMACIVALADLWVPGKDRIVTYCIAQASLGAIALGQLWYFYEGATYYAMQRMVVADPMGHLLGLFAMANCGLPGTAGFVGEWLVILGTVKVNFWIAAAAATTLIWGAGYTLWMVKRVYFGEVANEHVRELVDLDRREFAMLAALAIAVLAMGLYPKPFTDVMHTSVVELLRHVSVPKLAP